MRFLVVIALLLASGCDVGTFERRPGQDEAERIVWNGLYGMSGHAPPVKWVHKLVLWNGGGGFTLIGSHVEVADGDPDEQFTISATRFSHELMHYAEWVRTGDVDPFHIRADWRMADHDAPAALGLAGL